jgi:hypothetical protein
MTHLTHNQKVIHGINAPVCVKWEEFNFNYNGGIFTVQYDYCDEKCNLHSVRVGNVELIDCLNQKCINDIVKRCVSIEESNCN